MLKRLAFLMLLWTLGAFIGANFGWVWSLPIAALLAVTQ